MKHQNRFFLLLCVLLVGYAAQIGGDSSSPLFTERGITQDFTKATLTVTPHTAMSPIPYFEQDINVCNKETTAQYVFVDYNFGKNLKDNGTLLYKQKVVLNHTRTKINLGMCTRETYEDTYLNNITQSSLPTNKTRTICQNRTSTETEEIIEYVPYKVAHAVGQITGEHHYLNTQGILTQPSQCHEFKIKYRPNDKNGKWDFRAWGTPTNDWTCINDASCTFDYTLDPWFNTTCAKKRNISMTNIIGTKTINLTILSGMINTTTTRNQSNITFADASETTKLNFLIDYINSSGNTQQEIQAFINISNNDSIWMYYDCAFPTTQEVRTTGNTSPVMFGYWNFDDGFQGFAPFGSGTCELKNVTTPILHGARMSAQLLNGSDETGNRQGCLSPGLFRIGQDDMSFIRYNFVTTPIGATVANAEQSTSHLLNPVGIGDYQIRSRWAQVRVWEIDITGGTMFKLVNSSADVQIGNLSRTNWIINYSQTDPTVFGRMNGDRVGNSTANGFRNAFSNLSTFVFGGAGLAGWYVDDIKVWAQNNDTVIMIGAEENLTTPTTTNECSFNSFSLNVSAFEYDGQTAFLNVTSNGTNITDIDVSFFFNNQNLSTNITNTSTPNGTGTVNNLFAARYTTPIIATNATNLTANWTIVCYLNNNTIRTFNTSNLGQIIRFAHTIQNINFTTPVREAARTNYSINLTQFKSITQTNVTFYYNDTRQRNATQLTTNTINDDNTSYYNITRFAAGLVFNNNSAQPFVFELLILYGNGSTKLLNSSTINQSVIFNFVIGNTISNPLQVVETLVSNISTNISIIDATDVSATIINILEWNNTNTTNTSGTNISNEYTFGHFRFAEFVAGNTQATYNVSVKPFFNITVNQQSLIRNGTNLSRTIHRMAVTQCGLFSTTQAINYSVLDQDTNVLINPSSIIHNYLVWITNQSANRTYSYSSTGMTHAACINPVSAELNTVRDLEYTATGYNTRTSSFGPFLSTNVTQLIDLFLLNSSSATSTQVIITVLDQDDDAQQNKLVTIERVINLTNFTLIDSGLTDFQGQIAFTLDLDFQYRINISDGGTLMTLTSGGPASVGPFQILSNTLTFRVLTQTGSSLLPLVQIVSLAHTLVFSNSSKTFTLNFSDPSDYASNICLQVKHYNLSGETLLGQNCSTLATDTINFGIGPLNGSFTAFAIATSNLDALRYVFDTLSITVVEGFIFDNEGYAASILITGTAGIMGAVVTGGNPVGLMLGSLIGLGLSAVLGLISLGWATLLGLAIIGGLLIFFIKT